MSRFTTNQKGFTIVELMFSTTIFSAVLLLCLSALVQIGRMYYKGVTTSQTQEAARAVLDELTQAIQLSAGNIKAPVGIAADGITLLAAPVGPVINVAGATVADIPKNAMAYFCIGTTRYTYALDRKQSPSAGNNVANKEIYHAFWVDEPSICADAASTSDISPTPVDLTAAAPTKDASGNPTGRNLLSDNMRITRLILVQPAGSTDNTIWQIQLTIAYGDDDVLVVDDAGTPADTSDDRRICRGSYIGTQFCAFSELSTIVKRRVLSN